MGKLDRLLNEIRGGDSIEESIAELTNNLVSALKSAGIRSGRISDKKDGKQFSVTLRGEPSLLGMVEKVVAPISSVLKKQGAKEEVSGSGAIKIFSLPVGIRVIIGADVATKIIVRVLRDF